MLIEFTFPAEDKVTSKPVLLDFGSQAGGRAFCVNDVLSISIGNEVRKYRVAKIRLGQTKKIDLARVIEPSAAITVPIKKQPFKWPFFK